ncbi:hypothetical protein NQ318_021465 [Aromia moschata]|uniref:Peptidase S1 domain-containing protein n=1 Tax=Aromia moschata TaxID=1265417 RepID=A0AAV8ZD31_9CUCU|nr:hypothetical protein NQ318_021465 [Aromia moschata]
MVAVETETTTAIKKPGEISRQKCEQYVQQTTRTPARNLIDGGTPTTFQEFPHMALIGYVSDNQTSWSCGGSLISKNFILTAAHCIKSQLGPPKYVRLGITELSNLTLLQEFHVNQSIPHPEYKFKSKYHDIGLIKLPNDVNVTREVRPACLRLEKDIPQKSAIATGWGNVKFIGPSSSHLLKTFFTTKKCNESYQSQIVRRKSSLKHGILDELMVCAGSSTAKKNTCQGDSGGPLQLLSIKNSKFLYTVVGITSFGRACTVGEDNPGIYTRVSAYVPWIESIVWPDELNS